MTIPALVLAFKAVLTVCGNSPLEEEDDEGSVQKTIPRKVVIRLMAKMEYESRKKPVPATRIARRSGGCYFLSLEFKLIGGGTYDITQMEHDQCLRVLVVVGGWDLICASSRLLYAFVSLDFEPQPTLP